MKNSKVIFLQILNIIGFLGMVAVNALANIVRFNGKNTGELSDLYPNLFVPAGITFAVWGVIYLLLLLFTIYQSRDLFSKTKTTGPLVEKIGLLFFISCLANGLWIFAWHYERVLISLLIMVVLLVMLVMVYLRLRTDGKTRTIGQKIMTDIPFSVYLGWISIATIANVTAVLVRYHWNGFGLPPIFWTLLMIGIGLVLTLVMLVQRNDIYYVLVVAWAFCGIYIKRSNIVSADSRMIMTAILIGLALMIFFVLIRFKRIRNY